MYQFNHNHYFKSQNNNKIKCKLNLTIYKLNKISKIYNFYSVKIITTLTMIKFLISLIHLKLFNNKNI
jgi:hypothetical protein